jgi:hypothetical protein
MKERKVVGKRNEALTGAFVKTEHAHEENTFSDCVHCKQDLSEHPLARVLEGSKCSNKLKDYFLLCVYRVPNLDKIVPINAVVHHLLPKI